jgi:hypothetical protein
MYIFFTLLTNEKPTFAGSSFLNVLLVVCIYSYIPISAHSLSSVLPAFYRELHFQVSEFLYS